MKKLIFRLLFLCFCRVFCALFKLSGCYSSDPEQFASNLMAELTILKKENEILKRQSRKKKLKLSLSDRLFFAVTYFSGFVKLPAISIIRPETVLRWTREFIKGNWTFPNNANGPGRPPVDKETKNLILQMKLDNLFWGTRSIVGELKKLKIFLDRTTVRNILKAFRQAGKIIAGLTWRKFLLSQIRSIFASDFFTVDTPGGKRFYVFFIIRHLSREIVQFAVTENPTVNFLKTQLKLFEEKLTEMNISKAYLIHDNSGEFFFMNYKLFHFTSVPTSVEAPNMNAIAERFVGTVRRQCLDWYIIVSEKQLRYILSEFFRYYNSKRPHQGIDYKIPEGYTPQAEGVIVSESVLSGLVHHYFRKQQTAPAVIS